MKLFFILCTVLIGIATCNFVTGCEILKSKRTSSIDSVSVTKKTELTSTNAAGGHVAKDESKRTGEYERTTYIFPKKDTNVFNFYNQQPAAVVYEKGRTEQISTKVDSGWYKLLEQQLKSLSDSVSKSKSEKTKEIDKETKGLGLIAVILIALGVVIFFKLIGMGLAKFTIIKRQ